MYYLGILSNIIPHRVDIQGSVQTILILLLSQTMRKAFTIILSFISIVALAQKSVIWYDPITVADKTYGNLHPRITLDHNYKPIVLWGDPSGRVFISRWDNKAFAEPQQINPAGKYAFTESWAGPELTSAGDTIYIVYKEIPEENHHVFIKHSYDGGRHFSIETEVDDSDGYISRFPTVSTDPYGSPLVAYMKLDRGFTNPRYVVAKSKDMGESFAGEALVKDFSGGRVSDCCPATVAASGNATIILYRDYLDGYRPIWAGISRNFGISFDKGLRVDSSHWFSKACPPNAPHGIIVGDTLYSVFTTGGGDSALIYMSKTSITGLAATTQQLTGKFTGLTSQNFPRIANSGNATAIAWEQAIGIKTQVCMYFTNDISAGLPAKYDTVANGAYQNLDVAMGGGHIYVVWQDDSSGNIMCRVGFYEESQTNKLLAENTTVALQRAANGKYFTVSLPNLSYCMMSDRDGREYEMDMKCKKNVCKIFTEDLDPGLYIVKLYCTDEKVYTYKYEVKEIKEKPEKDKDK